MYQQVFDVGVVLYGVSVYFVIFEFDSGVIVVQGVVFVCVGDDVVVFVQCVLVVEYVLYLCVVCWFVDGWLCFENGCVVVVFEEVCWIFVD